ncbi:patatin-like protein [Thermaurantiacus sp.]
MPEKELRLALVCYGGVSLVVYMHGVTKELWKLLRASEARQSRAPMPAGDTEGVWASFLDQLGGKVDLRVVCDVVTGASAGGINGIILGAAIVEGLDLEPLTDMWLEEADVERLLDPDARPGSRLVQFYKEPVAWYATRRSETLAGLGADPVGREVAAKLAGFIRSRWFKPPFSGPGFTAMLDSALATMRGRPTGPQLIPPALAFDLFVTVTDYYGRKSDIPIHSPPVVTETEHRRLLSFRSRATVGIDAARAPQGQRTRRLLGSRGSLVFAARATASFPGAFPAASVAEVDARLAEVGVVWEDRAQFLATQLASDRPPEEVLLIDGSVLDNAPFGPAIEVIRTRPAYREVDRRIVYVDPKPGLQLLDGGAGRARPPGFLTAMLRALAQIPREQPIRDNLEEIGRLSARIARTRSVIEAMAPAVDAAIARAVGLRFLLLPLTAPRLARARARILSTAARESGFAFAAYAQLRIALVIESQARLLAELAGASAAEAPAIAEALRQAADARGARDFAGADLKAPEASRPARFLADFDIGFRLRRLRFGLRRLNSEIQRMTDVPAREAAEQLKAALHAAADPYVALRQADRLREGMTRAAEGLRATPGDPAAASVALDALAGALALSAIDEAADATLIRALAAPALPRWLARAFLRDWLGFPFYDIALLPLLGDTGFDSLEEIKVDRISPDDSSSLGEGGATGVLKGWQLNGFGAFFARGWRENDYLWGRLNAAERLVDILLSAMPGPVPAGLDVRAWKARLFSAILEAERARLTTIAPLIDRIEGVLATWRDRD